MRFSLKKAIVSTGAAALLAGGFAPTTGVLASSQPEEVKDTESIQETEVQPVNTVEEATTATTMATSPVSTTSTSSTNNITMNIANWGLEFTAPTRQDMEYLQTQLNSNQNSIEALATAIGIPFAGLGGVVTNEAANQFLTHFSDAASIIQTQLDNGQTSGGVRITVGGAQGI